MLGFYKQPKVDILIVTGPCRTGKTTISKILAKQDHFEFLDEPWLGMFLPVLVTAGEMREELAAQMLNSYFDELVNDVMLCRRANFRPGDRSSIRDFKSSDNINYRLETLQNREDAADYARANQTTLIIALPETSPFIDFLLSASERNRVLLLERDRQALINEIVTKQWFSDAQLKAPQNNQPFTQTIFDGSNYYMPWWLTEDQFEIFIQSTDEQRASFYAEFFHKAADEQCKKLSNDATSRLMKINSQDVFEKPDELVTDINQFIEALR